jgi:hypothetical protein
MPGAPNCIYSAKIGTESLEKACREAIEEMITALVRIKDLHANLVDCTNFDKGPDEELKSFCEDLLRSLSIVQEDADRLAEISNNLFENLGFKAEWDDKREEWYLTGECEEEL